MNTPSSTSAGWDLMLDAQIHDDVQNSETLRSQHVKEATHEMALPLEEELRDTHLTDISPLMSPIKLWRKISELRHTGLWRLRTGEWNQCLLCWALHGFFVSDSSSRLLVIMQVHKSMLMGIEHGIIDSGSGSLRSCIAPPEGASASKRYRNDTCAYLSIPLSLSSSFLIFTVSLGLTRQQEETQTLTDEDGLCQFGWWWRTGHGYQTRHVNQLIADGLDILHSFCIQPSSLHLGLRSYWSDSDWLWFGFT